MACATSFCFVCRVARIVFSFPTQSQPSTPSSSFSSWMWMLETPKKREAEVLRGLHKHPKFHDFLVIVFVTWHANPLRWPMKSTLSSREARETMGMKPRNSINSNHSSDNCSNNSSNNSRVRLVVKKCNSNNSKGRSSRSLC